MDLSVKDYKKILGILDTIYSAPDTATMFRGICERLRGLIGIYSAVFAPTDPRTREYYFTGYEIFDNSEAGILLYLDHYAPLDPFIAQGWYRNENITAQNTDLVSERSLIRSEFGCDFLLSVVNVFYILASSLISQGDMVGTCGFHRQKNDGNFSDRDKRVLNILLPHMARAIHNLHLMRDIELSKEPGGMIMTREDGQPMYMNNAAKQILKGVPVELVPDPGLGSAPVFFRNMSGTYRVRTVPLNKVGKGKIILFERYPPEHRIYTKLTDTKLSRREREVTALVIQGHSNREIAEQLFICEQTVKDHLHEIFEKLAIKRRSELAANILGLRMEERIPRRSPCNSALGA